MRRILTDSEIADAAKRYADGETLQVIADRLGVTLQAVWYRLQRQRLGARGIGELRRARHQLTVLKHRYDRSERQRKAASVVIRLLQPSRKRRSLFVPLLQAKYGLTHTDANRLVSLAKNAGEFTPAARADRVLVEMMRRYLNDHPTSGFAQLFSVLRRYMPGSRLRALDLYRHYFAERAKRAKYGSKSVAAHRKMPVRGALNEVWSMDFIQGTLPSGDRFWVLTVIDDFNREAIIAEVMKRRSATAVVRALTSVIQAGRKPQSVRTDHGGEFKSNVYREWMRRSGIDRIHSRPHTPADNCHIEQFNGTLRLEVLSQLDYSTLAQAQHVISDWLLHYNYVRPNKPCRGMSPMQYAAFVSAHQR